MSEIEVVEFDAPFLSYLLERGVTMAAPSVRAVHRLTQIEPPVSLHLIDIWAFPAKIGAFSYFGDGHFYNAEIGRYCSVASGLRVGASQHPSTHLTSSPIPWLHSAHFEDYVARQEPGWARRLPPPYSFDMRPKTTIGNDVWIGIDVYIKDGVTIGDGAIIGAHSVVTRDVEPFMIVVGNPAKPIRARFSDQIVERALRVRWWDYNIFDMDVDARDMERSLDRLEEMIERDEIAPYVAKAFNFTDARTAFDAHTG